MMLVSPLSSRWSTACEKMILERDRPDNFITRKWTLESDFPSSQTIKISSKVDKETIIDMEHIREDIDKIPLPYSTELEKYITSQNHVISFDTYISIIPISLIAYIEVSKIFAIPKFCETFPYSRIKIAICRMSKGKHIQEHFFSVLIENSYSFLVESIEPVSLDKSREFFLKISKLLDDFFFHFRYAQICIDQYLKMCTNCFKNYFLHGKTLSKTPKKAIKKTSPKRGFSRN